MNLVDVPSIRAVALFYRGGQGLVVYLATPALLTVQNAKVASVAGLGYGSPNQALFFVGGVGYNNQTLLIVNGASSTAGNARQLLGGGGTGLANSSLLLQAAVNVTNVAIRNTETLNLPHEEAVRTFGFDPFARDEPLLHVGPEVRPRVSLNRSPGMRTNRSGGRRPRTVTVTLLPSTP